MNQKHVWNNIAREWYEFKTKPAEHTLDFLKKKTGNILDLGSGAGRNLVKIKNQKMHLVDFSKEMIKLAKERAKQKGIDAEFKTAKLTKLPYGNNFFDAAICTAIFHCIKPSKQKKSVRELFRVLKPGAEAEITVWNKNSKRFKNSPKERYVKWRDKGARYYYLFDEKEIHDLFKKAGFKIKKRFEPQRNIIFIAEKPI